MTDTIEAPERVTITHPDGRTAQVSPKVAAFLAVNERWVVGAQPEPTAPTVTKAKGKAKAEPEPEG